MRLNKDHDKQPPVPCPWEMLEGYRLGMLQPCASPSRMLPTHATLAGTSPNQGFVAKELCNALLGAQDSPAARTALLPHTVCWREAPSPPREMPQLPQLRDAKHSPYLASQVQHVSVGIIEREEET